MISKTETGIKNTALLKNEYNRIDAPRQQKLYPTIIMVSILLTLFSEEIRLIIVITIRTYPRIVGICPKPLLKNISNIP